jgi:hypothetical protein
MSGFALLHLLTHVSLCRRRSRANSTFALAYAGLADAYALLGGPEAGGDMPPGQTLPKAKAAARKAVEIDESLAEPHVSLAHVNYFLRLFVGW